MSFTGTLEQKANRKYGAFFVDKKPRKLVNFFNKNVNLSLELNCIDPYGVAWKLREKNNNVSHETIIPDKKDIKVKASAWRKYCWNTETVGF